LYGAVEFLLEAKEAGILPIIGLEAYVAPATGPSAPAAVHRDRSTLFT
jgi:DNA polymerase III alpha subunit